MTAKKILYNPILKIIAFIIIVTLTTSAILVLIETIKKITYPEAILQSSYEDSYELRSAVFNNASFISRTFFYYRSEDYIKSGGTIPNSYHYDSSLSELYSQYTRGLIEEDYQAFNEMSEDEFRDRFAKQYEKEIEQARNRKIKIDLKQYQDRLDQLNSTPGLFFYIASDGRVLSNTANIDEEFIKSKPVYLAISNNLLDTNLKLDRYALNSYRYKYGLVPESEDIFYLALSNEFFKESIEQWNTDRTNILAALSNIAWKLIIALLCFIYLALVAGKRANNDGIHLCFYNRLFLEIQGMMVVLAGLGAFQQMTYADLLIPSDYIFSALLLSIFVALGLGLVLSAIVQLKNKSFLNFVLIYYILSKMFKLLKMTVNSFPVGLKMLPTPQKATNLKNIIEGTKHIKNGNLDYIIRTRGGGIYAQLAADINNINEGLKASIDNELKSERLKTELITNVSHDIRTPLTSIITYIDLLKNEESAENAKEFLLVLEKKALRLKNLTDDLFEASKASSGSIPTNLERIDIIALLEQGLGELELKIKESGLQFRFSHPPDKIFIRADGRLLWRAVENLLSNALKYSLPNSRVYIEIIDNKHRVDLVVKNISAYELNVDASELVKRFTRSDESRSSEGSGLGLNIAKSLIQLQHGELTIEIDGDLFKVIVTMPKWQ